VTTTWAALSDPNRRAVMELLLERPRAVNELVERLGLSQPGTSKHLRVLREAGLVRVRVDAQKRVYALEPKPLAELDAWLGPYRRLWSKSLDALERHLDEE
jgi:DNA-binding transcriptional ArsR family regulator